MSSSIDKYRPYTIPETAKFLGYSKSYIYYLVQEGYLSFLSPPNRKQIKIPGESIIQFINNNTFNHSEGDNDTK